MRPRALVPILLLALAPSTGRADPDLPCVNRCEAARDTCQGKCRKGAADKDEVRGCYRECGHEYGWCEQKCRPWIDRAEEGVKEMMQGVTGATVARTVLSYLHPTGKNPQVKSTEVKRLLGHLVAMIAIQWSGDAIGSSHVMVIEWEFDRRRSLRAVVAGDEDPSKVAPATAKLVDEYFQRKVHSMLRTFINDSDP